MKKNNVESLFQEEFKDKSSRKMLKTQILEQKWKFLIFIILSQFGQQFNLQAIDTVQVPLQKSLSIDEKHYGYLIMAQSLPNIFLPVLNGYIVDYLGGLPGFTAAILLTLLGQGIITLGAYNKSFTAFLIGKVISITALEATTLGRIKLFRLWFDNTELNRADSAVVLTQTISVILCDLLYPNLFEATGIFGFPFLVGFFICVFSAGMLLVVNGMHTLLLKQIEADKLTKYKEQISFSTIKRFPPLLWPVVLTVSSGLTAFIMTKIYLSKFLQVNFGYSIGEAGLFLAVSQLLSAVAAVAAGYIADKHGKLPYILIASSTSLIMGIGLIIIIPQCQKCFLPALPIILLSVVTSPLFIASYGSIARLVPQQNLGMATSGIPVLISIQMTVFPALGGTIAAKTYDTSGYTWVFALNLCVAAVSLISAISVQIADVSKGSILQHTGKSSPREAELEELPMINRTEENFPF